MIGWRRPNDNIHTYVDAFWLSPSPKRGCGRRLRGADGRIPRGLDRRPRGGGLVAAAAQARAALQSGHRTDTRLRPHDKRAPGVILDQIVMPKYVPRIAEVIPVTVFQSLH